MPKRKMIQRAHLCLPKFHPQGTDSVSWRNTCWTRSSPFFYAFWFSFLISTALSHSNGRWAIVNSRVCRWSTKESLDRERSRDTIRQHLQGTVAGKAGVSQGRYSPTVPDKGLSRHALLAFQEVSSLCISDEWNNMRPQLTHVDVALYPMHVKTWV